MKHATFAIALALAGVLVAAPAQANRDPTEVALEAEAIREAEKIVDVEGYLAMRQAELQEVEDGGYGKIRRSDMDRLKTAYATMQRLLQGRRTALELGTPQRVELFNAQETISSILAHQSENALICERIKATGSHMRQTRCHTRAQRESQRNAEQEGMLRTNHRDPGICEDPTRC